MSKRDKIFKELQLKAEELASEMAALRDEVQDGLDNLPENFQGTETAMANESRVDELERYVDYLEEITEYDWDNP